MNRPNEIARRQAADWFARLLSSDATGRDHVGKAQARPTEHRRSSARPHHQATES